MNVYASNENIISSILLHINFGKMVAIPYLDSTMVAETSVSITEVSTSANGPYILYIHTPRLNQLDEFRRYFL